MRKYVFPALVPLVLIWLGAAQFGSTARAPRLNPEEFQRLSLTMSESSGHFGTDNLVSNETSFLHVRKHLGEYAQPGMAYVGVGPDQNFTYIEQVRPALAYIIDIRRDNLLHHLYYKGIFLESRDRWDFLSMLFGKPLPDGLERSKEADASQLEAFFRELPADRDFFESSLVNILNRLRQDYPELVLEPDKIKILHIAATFFEDGLDVRYEIPGRPMLRFFPSFGQLMRETDLDGRQGHYLNSESGFQFLKEMQQSNRIIPVVGNFAGGKALKAIGADLKQKGLKVSVFYLSNVEFYLFRNRIYRRFVENVRHLPIDRKSLFIRSYFNNWFGTWRTHPHAVLNYFSTSLTQRIERFLELDTTDPYKNYWDLVTRDYLGAPGRPASVL